MTPMLQQYFSLKKECGDAVLFFRMGDFYEVFGDDALVVAPLLNIVITHRNRKEQEKMPFCGVPHHSYKPHCRKLIEHGFKVAIAEQITHATAAGEGIVGRKIVKIITPGLHDDLDSLDDDKPNYFASLYEDPQSKRWSVLIADISTGELRLGTFVSEQLTFDFVRKNTPREILARAFQHQKIKDHLPATTVLMSTMPEIVVSDDNQRTQTLQDCFAPTMLASYAKDDIARVNLAAFALYLQQNHYKLDNFLHIKPLLDKKEMDLGANVIRDLEIFATIQTRSAKGSLYNVVNNTLTPMGARLLRYVLAHPLTDRRYLTTRLDAVTKLVARGYQDLCELRKLLQGFPDLERLSNQMLNGSVQPAQLAAMLTALAKITTLAERHDTNLLGNDGQTLAEVQQLLTTTLLDRPARLGLGIEVFRPQYDQELGQYIELMNSGEEKINAYEQQLKNESGIPSLKIKKHRQLGLVIEVSRAQLPKVPSNFTRRQSMVNCERYVTTELVQLDQALNSALGQAIAKEEELYQQLLQKLQPYHQALLRLSSAVAGFDLHQSHAFIAVKENWCRPQLGNGIALKNCRHPVIEKLLGAHRFVPNNIELHPEAKTMLITGPNMGGKSTVMRQVALSAILHQSGAYVPAASATLPLFDNIFTRIGASDNITAGQSTFMVEMCETATILRESSTRSLVIVDEIGRGTSTSDGLALARAILENLSRARCFCLFSTHFHELVPATAKLNGIKTMQTEVQHNNWFTHKLIPGSCSQSFGIEVARQAGVPAAVLKRATQLLQENRDVLIPSSNGYLPSATHQDNQLLQTIARRFEKLNIYQTTPLQALNFVSDLKAMFSRTSQQSLLPDADNSHDNSLRPSSS